MQTWYIQAVPLADTSPEVRAMQFRILKAMSGAQRLQIACDMTDALRELAKAGIRRQHPEWSEREVILELLRRALWPLPLPAQLK